MGLNSPGFTTHNIPHDSISASQLVQCDALLDPATHVALFWGWADAAKTKPIVVEEYSTGHFCELRTWSSLRGYQPIRRQGWPATGPSGGSQPVAAPVAPHPVPVAVPVASSGTSSGSSCTVTASSGLNIRSCASTTCAIIVAISNGATVRATGEKNGIWYKISSPRDGWVSSEYLHCAVSGFRVQAEVGDDEHVEGDNDASERSAHSPGSKTLIIGLSVGIGILVVVLVAIIVVVVYLRRRRASETV